MPRAITEPNAGSKGSRMHHFCLNKLGLARCYLGPVDPDHRLPRLKPSWFYTFQLPLPSLPVTVLRARIADCVVDRLITRHGSPHFAHTINAKRCGLLQQER
jgi:hypothetical protein